MLRCNAAAVVVLVILLLLCSVAFASRPIEENARHAPTMVVLPIQVDCDSRRVAAEVDSMTLEAFRKMGFRVITGQPVANAMRRLNINYEGLSSHIGQPGSGPLLSSKYDAPQSGATQEVLNEQSALRIGQYLGANYVTASYYRVWTKTTRSFVEKVLNGRCTLHTKIIDVSAREVVYEWQNPANYEFGADNSSAGSRQTRIGIVGIGALMAGGVLGKGSVTRTLGWGMMAAPAFIKNPGTDSEKLEYLAALRCINEVYGDFYDRIRYRF